MRRERAAGGDVQERPGHGAGVTEFPDFSGRTSRTHQSPRSKRQEKRRYYPRDRRACVSPAVGLLRAAVSTASLHILRLLISRDQTL